MNKRLSFAQDHVRIEFMELKEGSFAVADQFTPKVKDEWEGSDNDR